MNVLDGDVAELLASAARGALSADAVTVAPRHAVCVVLAAPGYPEAPRGGDVIKGLDEAAAVPGVTVFHAGTRRDAEGVLRSAGGRVLNVVARGATVAEARARAYAAVARIDWPGAVYRRDIAARAITPRTS